MEKVPAVSIIVAVYKAEKYIHRCIDSLLVQSFTDFEVLLVDDGSPDNSGKICDEYAKNDSRVRVFHKENDGVSSARQYGTDNATGEYIIHIDSDDWVEKDMLKDLYEKAVADNADMVICDYYVDYENKSTKIKQKPSAMDHVTVLKEHFINLHGSCCNKLIKSTFYKNYGIKFPKNMHLCEDLYVIASILKYNMQIAYIPSAYYHYIQDNNQNSLTKAVNSSYEYDKFLLTEFCNLVSEYTDILKLCQQKFSFQIVANSYVRKDFSSRIFKKKCGMYLKSVQAKKGISSYYKFKLVMSCLGFYRLMLIIDEIKSSVRYHD